MISEILSFSTATRFFTNYPSIPGFRPYSGYCPVTESPTNFRDPNFRFVWTLQVPDGPYFVEFSFRARLLIAEAVAKLRVNLPRLVPVKSTKRQTVIQLHA